MTCTFEYNPGSFQPFQEQRFYNIMSHTLSIVSVLNKAYVYTVRVTASLDSYPGEQNFIQDLILGNEREQYFYLGKQFQNLNELN
jgi:hypothetical protein